MDQSNESIFNVKNAKSLIDDPYSALKIVSSKRRISLLPSYVNKLKIGIRDVLDSELRKFSERLDGLLIAYENIRLINNYGVASFDEPYIHLEIQGDFIIFQPVIGSTLRGLVNKKGKNHISCLVHSVFNASLPRPPADEKWIGDDISVGDEILFKISHLDLSSRVIFIRGFILSISSTNEKPEANKETSLLNGDAFNYEENDSFINKSSGSRRLSKDLQIAPKETFNNDSDDNSDWILEEDVKYTSVKTSSVTTLSPTTSSATVARTPSSKKSPSTITPTSKKRSSTITPTLIGPSTTSLLTPINLLTPSTPIMEKSETKHTSSEKKSDRKRKHKRSTTNDDKEKHPPKKKRREDKPKKSKKKKEERKHKKKKHKTKKKKEKIKN